MRIGLRLTMIASLLGVYMLYYFNRISYYDSSVQKRHSRLSKNLYQERIFVNEMDHQMDSHPRNMSITKCTLIMPTYKRVVMLPLVINHYCKMSALLHQVMVVWNDADTPIPPSISELEDKCDTQLKILSMKENKLSNRFLPRNRGDIETECVFILDDDIIVSWEDIKFGLLVWQKFRHLIVGFEGRTRSFSILKGGSYVYGVANNSDLLLAPVPGSYAIILPGFFVHKAYLEMLFDSETVPPKFIEYVDTVMNCEDILVTVMVTKFLRDAGLPQMSAGLAVEPQHSISNLKFRKGAANYMGLKKRLDHFNIRSRCLQKFVDYFGKESLVLTRVVVKKSTDWPMRFNEQILLDRNGKTVAKRHSR